MPLQDVLAPLFAGAVFAYLYSQEKEDFLLKFTFLFVAVALITFSFFNATIISQTTLNSISGITAYTFTSDSALIPFGLTLGLLLTFLIVWFIWKLVRTWRA
jgi:hypothetical protein